MPSTDTPPLAEGDPIQPRSLEEKTGRYAWMAMLIGLLFVVVPLSTGFHHGGGPMDEGTVLVYPEMVQRGAVPYRDFETFYGPANPYLLAAVYTVFGTEIGVERTVGLLYRVVILIAIFGLTRGWGMAIATVCLVMSGLLLVPMYVVAYAWFGAVACALCFLWTMARGEEPWRCFLGGLLAAIALTFRPDVGPAVVLAAMVLVQPLAPSLRWKFFLGAAIGLIPFAVVLVVAGLEQVFNNLFLYPVLRSGPARRIPFFAADPFFVRLFFAMVLAALVNILAGILAVRAYPAGRRERVLLAFALVGAGVLPQAWQRLDLSHLLFVAFLVIGLLPLSLFSFAIRRGGNRKEGWLALGSASIVAFLVVAIAPYLMKMVFSAYDEALQTTPAGSLFVQRGSRSFPVGPVERVISIGRLLDDLERLSKPGERLFVGPKNLRHPTYNDTFIYHLVPSLRPATYFLEMNPLSANRPGSRLASDVMSADWLVLNREWDAGDEPNPRGPGSADAVHAAIDHFQVIGQYGSFALLRRKR
jgi:hypothetical protein